MATAIAQPVHPYFEEIDSLFYNYRLAQLNRRYYTVLLARKRCWNLWTQVFIGLLSATAAALIGLTLAFHPSTDLLAKWAAVSSAIAFILSVAALSVAQKRSPFALLARWCVLARAACILLGEMAEGAWARRNRWQECVERARRF